jgi:hypothetical protein
MSMILKEIRIPSTMMAKINPSTKIPSIISEPLTEKTVGAKPTVYLQTGSVIDHFVIFLPSWTRTAAISMYD